MKLSTWQPQLKVWLTKVFPAFEWSLAQPDDEGERTASLYPLQDLSYTLEDIGDLVASATQVIHLRLRLSSDLYHTLDLNTTQGLYATIAYRLARSWASIHPDLLQLDLLDIDSPIEVRQAEGRHQGDWLLDLVWYARIKFVVTPEDEADTELFLRVLTVDLYRSMNQREPDAEGNYHSDKTLDTTLTFEYPEPV